METTMPMPASRLPDQFGPLYPRELGAVVSRFRSKARRGLRKLTFDERRAYGNAVSAAIRRQQKSALARETPSHNVNCASGTNYSDGREIAAAIRRQHASELQAYVAFVRRNRTDEQWRDMYACAMAEKRERQAKLAEAPRRPSIRRRRASVYSAVLGAYS